MTRRRIALVLTILWIVGFELMPWAHIALHDHLPHHHHDENGGEVIDDLDADVDEHAADRADLDPESDEHAGDLDPESDEHAGYRADRGDAVAARVRHHTSDDAEHALLQALAHGRHSLAHHGIAVPVPAPASTCPLPVDRRPILLAVVVRPAWISAPIPEASARGPPPSPV